MRARQDESAPSGRRRGRFWPTFIVTLLLIHVGGVVTLVLLATDDPSFQVEEDYYVKGLAWDERMKQERDNQQLGWTSEVSLTRSADGRGFIQARLSDAEGAPVTGAEITLVTFHKARAGQSIRSTLRELAPGTYASVLPLRRPGIWEIRLVARHGDARFTQRVDRELQASGANRHGSCRGASTVTALARSKPS